MASPADVTDPTSARGVSRSAASGRTGSGIVVLPFAFALGLLALLDETSAVLELARALLLLIALGHAGDRIGSRLMRARDAAERAWIALLFAAGGAVGVATWLGAFGLLRREIYLPAIAAAWLASSLLLPRAPRARPLPEKWGRFAALAAVAFALAILAHDLHARRFTPAGAVAYDDVSYHLPAALLFERFGDLRTLRFAFGDPSTSFYPLAGELASWVLFTPFAGNDLLARWSQLPAAIGLLLVGWRLARETGASAVAAAVTTPLLLSVRRLYPELAFSAGNDLWAAFAALSAVLALVRLHRRPAPGEATVLGLAVGLLVGTKYFALLLLPGILLWSLVLGTPRGCAAISRSRRVRIALLAAVTALAIGGFTYLRNAIAMGNPFFPQPLALWGYEILPGWPSTGLLARLDRAKESLGTVGDLLALADLMSAPWRWLLLPTALLVPIVWVATRHVPSGRRRGRRRFALALAFSPAVVLALYSLLLYEHRDVRQIAVAFPLASASLVWAADLLPRRLRWAALAVLAATAGGALVARRAGIEPAALALGVVTASAIAWKTRRPRSVALAGLAAAAALVATGPPTLARNATARLRYEPVALELERLTGATSVKLAYVGGNRPYPFWGSRFQNVVEIVPLRGGARTRFYSLDGWPRIAEAAGRSRRLWLANLNDLGIEWLVVDRDGLGSSERRWMAALPRRFALVARLESGEVWRFVPR